jgi:WD repeat-containing protein 61
MQSPNGRLLASGSADGAVFVFDVASQTLLFRIDGKFIEVQFKAILEAQRLESIVYAAHGRNVRSLTFTPDSQTLITASDDLHIKMHDVREAVQQGSTFGDCAGHASWVLAVAASPTGETFATGCVLAGIAFYVNVESCIVDFIC